MQPRHRSTGRGSPGLLRAVCLALTLLPAVVLAPDRTAGADNPPPPPPPAWNPDWDRDPSLRRKAPQPRPRGPAPRVRPRAQPPRSGAVVRPPAPAPQPGVPRPRPDEPPPDRGDTGIDRIQGTDVIRRIEFKGNVLYSAESIKVKLLNKEGRRLDKAALVRDMETLHSFFKWVRITQENVAGGIVLRFTVSEYPLVVQLVIRGAEEMDESEIRGMMQTRERFPLSPYHLAADVENIVEAYRLRGFHFAHIPEPQITRLANGGRRIDLSIVEGPEVSVERIIFRGNQHIPRKDLLEVMQTEGRSFFENILNSGGTFREDVLREDLVALKRLYRDEGFLDAEVFLDDLRFSDDKERATIVIAIVEHRAYEVGDVEIIIERVEAGESGSPPPEDVAFFTEERIRNIIGCRTGARFSGKKLTEGLEAVRDAYFARSYLEAVVRTPVQRGRQNELVVDLEITIVEGRKQRLARVDFYGNEFTRDKILRREVKLSPGGYIDRGELQRARERLQRTRFFDRVSMRMEDAVGPDGEPMDGWKSVAYEVIEAKTGNFNFGIGISTNSGAFGSITFNKRNFDIARPPRSLDEVFSRRAFTGAGQNFNVLLRPSTEQSQFRVGFAEPRLFGTMLSFNAEIFSLLAVRESYDEAVYGYRVGFGYPLYLAPDETSALTAGISWRHQRSDINDIEPDAVPGAFLFASQQETRAVRFDLSYGKQEKRVDPIWSWTLATQAELAGTVFGGDLDFVKVIAQLNAIYTVFEDDEGKKHRVSFKSLARWAEALEDTPELPPNERFYAGGTTFRGFEFRGVGPHANGQPMGGEWALVNQLEYEYPLIARTLSVVAFTDFGTLGTNIYEDDAFRWRWTAGLGLRIVIPFLGERPLAFDFALPIFKESEDERGLVSFSVGRDF